MSINPVETERTSAGGLQAAIGVALPAVAPVKAKPAPAAPKVEKAEVAAETATEKVKELDQQNAERITDGMNQFLAQGGKHVRFVLHEEAGRMMVQIRDDRTEEVIRTIPSKELLDLAAKMGDVLGMLLDEKT